MNRPTGTLALPELQSYSVAVALAVVYLELVRNATTAAEPGRTETLVEANHLTIWPGQSNGRQMPTCHEQAR